MSTFGYLSLVKNGIANPSEEYVYFARSLMGQANSSFSLTPDFYNNLQVTKVVKGFGYKSSTDSLVRLSNVPENRQFLITVSGMLRTNNANPTSYYIFVREGGSNADLALARVTATSGDWQGFTMCLGFTYNQSTPDGISIGFRKDTGLATIVDIPDLKVFIKPM